MVRSLVKAIDVLPSWGVLFAAIGWLPGVAIWQAFRHEGPTFSMTSKGVKVLLQEPQRTQLLNYGWASLGAIAAVYVGLYLFRRRRAPVVTYDAYFRLLNQRFLVLLALPLLTSLFTTKLEGKQDFLNLSLIAATLAVFAAWVYALVGCRRLPLSLPAAGLPPGRLASALPWAFVLVCFVTYGYVMSRFSIVDHRNLATANFDLGIYHNIVWNTANGDFLGCSFCRGGKHYSAHFDPILWILTPLYKLSPRAETLLVFQSFWLALGGIPLFLYARRVLNHAGWACTVVAAYYLMPALHGANLYDFHSLALLTPTAMFAVYFLDGRRFVGYWVSIAILLLTREDMSLLSCFIGLYAWFTGQKKTAVATVVAALAYLVTVKLTVMAPGLIMEDSSSARSFASYYQEMIPYREEGAFGLVATFLTDPVASLAVLFSEKKVIYFTLLLLPLLSLPLLSGKKRILMLYGLVFIGLATRKYVYSIHFQYSCLLLPFLALSVADAVVYMREAAWLRGFGLDEARLQRAVLTTLVVAGLLMGAEYGALAKNNVFRAGWSKIAWSQTDAQREQYQELLDVVSELPRDASISADSRTGPHVTDRHVVNHWPYVGNADYILMFRASSRGKYGRKYRALIKQGTYEVERSTKRFVVLRRVDEPRDAPLIEGEPVERKPDPADDRVQE